MSKMNLFNFYVDDEDKQKAIEKLDRLCNSTAKGKLASFLRIQIKRFINTPDDKVTKDLIELIEAEYVLTTTKTKRSKM